MGWRGPLHSKLAVYTRHAGQPSPILPALACGHVDEPGLILRKKQKACVFIRGALPIRVPALRGVHSVEPKTLAMNPVTKSKVHISFKSIPVDNARNFCAKSPIHASKSVSKPGTLMLPQYAARSLRIVRNFGV